MYYEPARFTIRLCFSPALDGAEILVGTICFTMIRDIFVRM